MRRKALRFSALAAFKHVSLFLVCDTSFFLVGFMPAGHSRKKDGNVLLGQIRITVTQCLPGRHHHGYAAPALRIIKEWSRYFARLIENPAHTMLLSPFIHIAPDLVRFKFTRVMRPNSLY